MEGGVAPRKADGIIAVVHPRPPSCTRLKKRGTVSVEVDQHSDLSGSAALQVA